MSAPIFQKRHYERIAETLKNFSHEHSTETTAFIATDFARAFKDDNPQFDESRFFKAVGLPPHYWTMPKSLESLTGR